MAETALLSAIDQVKAAFGAPGDYGYETKEGEALFALYKARAEASVSADDEAAKRAMEFDALRWRLTQRPGYFVNRSYEFSETESNVVVVYLGGEKAGCGRTVQEAVDCALHLTAEHGDVVPFAALLDHWRKHHRERRDGQRWVKPPAPQFDLSDDGRVQLREAANG